MVKKKAADVSGEGQTVSSGAQNEHQQEPQVNTTQGASTGSSLSPRANAAADAGNKTKKKQRSEDQRQRENQRRKGRRQKKKQIERGEGVDDDDDMATIGCHPVDIRQSDGILVLRSKRGGEVIEERNEPSKEQLDQTPNAQGEQDYYKLLDLDDPKAIDWRRKLGQRLVEVISDGNRTGKWRRTPR